VGHHSCNGEEACKDNQVDIRHNTCNGFQACNP
jgi:hypothetical protein